MNVQSILHAKGRVVHTIGADATLGQAAQQMRSQRVGALVVVDDGGAITGIVSDRGILWALAERGAGVMDEPLSGMMSRDVVTCSEEDHVRIIMGVMTERRIRHIPVVDSRGRLCGIVSIGDAVKHRLDEIQTEAEAMRDYISNAR